MSGDFFSLFQTTGIANVSPGMLVMWAIGLTLIYLAIAKGYEPLLLLPIGFGIILANLPLAGLMEPGSGLLWRFYHHGIQWQIIPPLIFLGLGALTDFGPLLANPHLIFLGAGAQVGVYLTFLPLTDWDSVWPNPPPSASSAARTVPPPFFWPKNWRRIY